MMALYTTRQPISSTRVIWRTLLLIVLPLRPRPKMFAGGTTHQACKHCRDSPSAARDNGGRNRERQTAHSSLWPAGGSIRNVPPDFPRGSNEPALDQRPRQHPAEHQQAARGGGPTPVEE